MIRIEGKVAEDDMIKMVIEKPPNGMTHFSSSGGIKIREELEEELKLVESTLGLFCKLSRVRWEYASSLASGYKSHRVNWLEIGDDFCWDSRSRRACKTGTCSNSVTLSTCRIS